MLIFYLQMAGSIRSQKKAKPLFATYTFFSCHLPFGRSINQPNKMRSFCEAMCQTQFFSLLIRVGTPWRRKTKEPKVQTTKKKYGAGPSLATFGRRGVFHSLDLRPCGLVRESVPFSRSYDDVLLIIIPND